MNRIASIALTRRTLLGGGAGLAALRLFDPGSVLAQTATPAAGGGDWPFYRYNADRTGEGPGPGVKGGPKLSWRAALPGPAANSSPAVGHGLVVIGTGNNYLLAFDQATGQERWRFQGGGGFNSSAAVVHELAYGLCDDGAVYAVDLTGKLAWTIKDTFYGDNQMLFAGSSLYLANNDKQFAGFDAKTGKEQWRVTMSDAASRSASFHDGVIFVGLRDGHFIALDATNGATKWIFDTGKPGFAHATPPYYKGVIYEMVFDDGGTGGTVFAIDAATGKERWHVFEKAFNSSIGVSAGLAFCIGTDGKITALDTQTGKTAWTLATGLNIGAAVDIVDGVVYAPSGDRFLYAIEATTGKVLWRFSFEGSSGYSPAVTNGNVYVATGLGYLYAIGGDGDASKLPIVYSNACPPMQLAATVATPAATLSGGATWVASYKGGKDGLQAPFDVAIAPDGDIFVSELGASRFTILNPDGSFKATWGTKGSGNGQFTFGYGGIAFDAAGVRYVLDAGNFRVQKFTADGAFVQAWGSFGGADGHFADPLAITVTSDGRVAVIDDQRDDVQVFDSNGRSVLKLGGHGVCSPELNSTGLIGNDGDGNVWIGDWGNNHVKRFDAKGNVTAVFGQPGDAPGQLNQPNDVTVDAKGNVFVSDTGNGRIQVFAPDGSLVAVIGGPGEGDDQFKNVIALALDGKGNLYATDIDKNVLHHFRLTGSLA